LSQLSTA